jgi:RhtX/FptX family siderophore transporter
VISSTTARKLALLGSLYLSQGLPFGFFTQALPVLMRQSGHSLEQVGLASLLAIPWALKFLWAPWIDRHGSPTFGRRKSWIVPLQLASAAVLALASWLEPGGQFIALFAVVLVVNALSATQDVATDGLAVEILDARERGLANGLQVAAYRLGMILGGGLLLAFFALIGWQLSFLLMASTIVAATLPVWLHREQSVETVRESDQSTLAAHFLRLPGVWRLLAMLFLFKFGDTLATTMLRPFMVDHGLGLADVGWLLGSVGFIAGLLGALAGGWLAGRLPRKTALIVCAAAQAATLAAYVMVAQNFPGKPALAWLIAAEHAGSGMATAALFTCMMDWCRREHAGADYTVQASTVVIASSMAAALSGITAQQLGYAGHFALAFAMGLVALVAVLTLFPSGERSLLPDDRGLRSRAAVAATARAPGGTT